MKTKTILWIEVLIIGLLLYYFGYLDTDTKFILFMAIVFNIDLYMDFKDISSNVIFTAIIIALLYVISMMI